MNTSAIEIKLITIAEACAHIPGRGKKRIHPSTICRWILSGCPSRGGARIKLAAVRVGGRWMLSHSALDEFFASLATTEPVPAAVPRAERHRTDFQRQAASEKAVLELERRGV